MGLKANIPDVLSAIGLYQIKRLKKFIALRTKLVKTYIENLKELKEIKFLRYKEDRKSAHHIFAIMVKNEKVRNYLIEKLKEYNIGAAVHFISVHNFSYYRKRYKFRAGDLPKSNALSKRILSLPLGNNMTEDDVLYVCWALKKIMKGE